MKKHYLLPLLVAAAVLVSGCQAAKATSTTSQTAPVTPSDMFTDRDLEVGYDETTAAAITLSGSTASCDSDAVTVSGSTITITDEGTYLLSGTLDDGMIIVDADDTDKIQLVLDGASIHCEDCAALYVRQANKVFVTTAADSQNTLSGGETFTPLDDNNIDGVIFSKSDLTLNGLGTLTVESPAGHGVVTKDDLAITSGTYVVNATGQGLSGKDSVRIADGTFTLTTGKDAIQSDNTEDTDKGFVYLAGGTFTITAEGDGMSASSWMQVDDAACTITTGGGSVNGETHTSDTAPGGMGGGKGGRMPLTDDGTAPPDGSTQPPERPTGETPPDGMEPPADMPQDAAPTDNAMASDAAADTTTAAADSADTSTTDTVSTKGLKAGTALTILGGSFTLDCADDAFHSNGDLAVSGGTAIIQTGDDAFHADGALTVSGGKIDISTCYEGLEGLTVTVSGGDINIVSSDDGVNAAGGADQSGFGGNGQDQFAAQNGVYITISGGNLTINAGGDGLDSNGDLTVSGGTVLVSTKDGSADSALDYNGSASITGGTLIGAGSSGMAQNFGETSTQGAILLTVDAQAAGSTVSVSDSSGNVLTSWEAPQSFSSVVISCPGLEADGTYTVTAGTSSTQVTLDGPLYGSGGTGHGGMGGNRGNRGEPVQDTAAAA
ncbi:carbohydrate-binding domain-containing protein [Candidatus Agathobaculum pullicola]|uniref:carbohydrate-binding domain-containing protein n=1 Tax=Candidatus Agathobaculum pullicola TaxID=2838426 RepID=UPI003F917F8D